MIIRVLGVPMDLGSGRRGVDMGPSAIRIAGVSDALKELGNKIIDEGDIDIHNMEEIRVGDTRARYLKEISRASKILACHTENMMMKGHFPLILGGDHSIAVGSISGVAAFAKKKRKKIGVLWVDAHGDLNTPATSPSGNVHGMPLASLLGYGPGDLKTVGGNFEKVDPDNVAIVGVRSLDAGERKLIEQAGIHVYTMSDIDRQGIHRVMKKALTKVTSGTEYVHVSFDLDAVDPTIAPGVGTPVKGGLDYREAHLIMESVCEAKVMTSLELVEVNPILDEHNRSAEFAVELVQSAFGKRIL